MNLIINRVQELNSRKSGILIPHVKKVWTTIWKWHFPSSFFAKSRAIWYLYFKLRVEGITTAAKKPDLNFQKQNALANCVNYLLALSFDVLPGESSNFQCNDRNRSQMLCQKKPFHNSHILNKVRWRHCRARSVAQKPFLAGPEQPYFTLQEDSKYKITAL